MARRKISKPAVPALPVPVTDETADALPELTPQQTDFVRAILAGKSATEAYREAYDCSNMALTTIWSRASEMKRHGKVSVWIREARKAKLGTAVLTIDSHIQELERLREIALETGNVGAAVQAEQLRGKATGIYIERHADVTPPDPTRALLQLARSDPVIGRALAAKFGLDVEPVKQIELQPDHADEPGEDH